MFVTHQPIIFTLALSLITGTATASTIRIATYNIRFLDTDFTEEGDRLEKLKTVIHELQADVIGLQEIDDRAALEMVFDKNEWHIIIDDDSDEEQDLALVVRKTLNVEGVPTDLDVEAGHFLFPDSNDDNFFPDRRDVLSIKLTLADDDTSFHVLVVHAKSRFGGRATTESRRAGASRELLKVLEQKFDGEPFILLGDFNDTPDDRSLNILETGNPSATTNKEEIRGPFLFNLTESLCAEGRVSFGRNTRDIDRDLGKVNTIDPEARERNFEHRNYDEHTGDQLFDQILIPIWMEHVYVPGSAKVFDHPDAAKGNDKSRASDHLPVFADFAFTAPCPARIASLLPNPPGRDRGKERVTLASSGGAAVDIDGWVLVDLAGNEFNLSSTIPSNGERVITLPPGKLPLNNTGDTIRLLKKNGDVCQVVSYSRHDVHEGIIISFD